ncbi:MAG: VRR-NUC domain-containing protein [Alphaproteobacteria bacterium]|nr:VRR-NUC domain-containing protein [Alphaproteobacteria bacterium]
MRKVIVTEADTLRACLALLRVHPRVAWAERINSGVRGGVRFGFPGCPDILGQLKDGRVLAVEVKGPLGRATAAQVRFLTLVRRWGGVSGVVRSTADLEALIRLMTLVQHG